MCTIRLALSLTFFAAGAQLASAAAASAASSATASASSAFARTYDGHMAEGNRLAAEASWARARDAYAEAAKLAKTDDARRWAQFRGTDAGWRSIAAGMGTSMTPETRTNNAAAMRGYKDELTAYLGPGERADTARDDFTAAVLESRADLSSSNGFYSGLNPWNDRLAVAIYLADQPPTREAAERFVAFLQRCLSRPSNSGYNMPPAMIAILEDGIRFATSADDRAWCAVEAAIQTNSPIELQESRWTRATEVARGTRWESHAAAGAFAWRADLGRDPDAPPDSTANFPALLAQLAEVRKGLDPAAKDSLTNSVRTSLANLEANWTRPQLNLIVSDANPAGEPLRIAYGTTGFSTVQFRILRLTPEQWAARKSPAPRSQRPAGAGVRDWSVTLPNPAALAWHSDNFEVPPLEPGFYTITALASGPARTSQPNGLTTTSQDREFTVSSLSAAAYVGGDGSGSLFLMSLADGAPVAQATVTGLSGASGSWRNWRGSTDADGRLHLDGVIDDSNGQKVVVATANGQPVWLQQYSSNPTRSIVDVFLDRPLYRPGETVHWKIIARERRNGALVVPTYQPFMTVQFGSEKLIDAKPVGLNAFGSASGDIVIPPQSKPDTAFLTIKTGPRTQDSYGTSFFTVDNYVPPAISATASLTSGPDSLRPGREVVVKVQASYLSGGPVAGTAVEGVFSSYGNFEASNANAFQSQQYSEWQRSLANAKEATTDALGAAELRLQLPDNLPATTTLNLSVRVIPDGGQPIQTSKSFTVTPTGSSVEPGTWTKIRLARPGENVGFAASIVDGSGEPRPFKGTAWLMERVWTEAWAAPDGRVVSAKDLAETRVQLKLAPDANLPAPWRRLEASVSSSPIAQLPVQTDADGKLTAAFTVPHAGYFQMQVSSGPGVLTTKGSQQEALTVLAADENTGTIPADPRTLQIVGPEMVTPGQPVRAFLILPEGQHKAMVSLQGDDAEVSKIVELRGRTGFVVFDKAPPAVNGVTVSAASMSATAGTGRGQRRTTQVTLPMDHAGNRLAVTLAPADDKPRPGSQSTVKLSVRDSAGKPVRAEVALSGSDEAVQMLGGNRSLSEDPAFWRPGLVSRWSFVQGAFVQTLLGQMTDPRRGALVNRSQSTVVLSPFGVASPASAPGARGGGGGRGGGGLDSFQVSSFDFGTGSVGAGGRLALNLQETPESYSVINREFIDALGITDMAESASWSPGQTFGLRQLGASAEPEVRIRMHFASTTLWAPTVMTDDQGDAVVPVSYVDNLTKWRFDAYAMGPGGDTFGKGRTFTNATLPLQARLQLPRFLVAGDSARASALVLNRTDQDMTATLSFAVDGGVKANSPVRPTTLVVPHQGEALAPLPVKAEKKGTAKFSLKAVSESEADAMNVELPVLEDGLQQLTAATGRVAPKDKSQTLQFTLPTVLDRDRTTVTVQLSPSYAAAILDALPYMVDYPYGCVEQTMNRFLPAVVVRKTLLDLGFEASAIERRILGKESAADRNRRMQTAGLGQLDEVIRESLVKLGDSSSYDGGFGWWPGAQSADPWMTAYVMWGTVLAKEAGVAIPANLASRLSQGIVTLNNGTLHVPVDVQGRMGMPRDPYSDGSVALLLATGARLTPNRASADADLLNIFERLYAARDQLPASGRACLFLASRTLATSEQRAVLLRNLENGALHSTGPGIGDTVHWGSSANYWRPMDGAVETTSLYLLALVESEPQHPLVEPALNWLLLNRRSAHWDSTRSTAFAVLALARCMQVRKEAQPDLDAEFLVNGRSAGRVHFTSDSLLEVAAPLPVDPALLRAGVNRIEVRRTSGSSPIYATALASSWATGAAVKPASYLISIGRTLERMKPQATLVGTVKLAPQPLPDGGAATAGEQVNASVRLSVPNDMEYIMVEVPKPAGCEPLNALSGWDARLVRIETDKDSKPVSPPAPNTAQNSIRLSPQTPARGSTVLQSGRGDLVYREEHDDKSVFFLTRIAAGEWEIRYGLRATTPGDFRTLPAQATAMYVPEVRANSDARRLRIDPRD